MRMKGIPNGSIKYEVNVEGRAGMADIYMIFTSPYMMLETVKPLTCAVLVIKLVLSSITRTIVYSLY